MAEETIYFTTRCEKEKEEGAEVAIIPSRAHPQRHEGSHWAPPGFHHLHIAPSMGLSL
jgi:hypothetical protein